MMDDNPWIWRQIRDRLFNDLNDVSRLLSIPEVYRAIVGAESPADWQAAYESYLRQHGLEQLKAQIVADHGRHRIEALYQEVWGHPIDSEYRDYYIFLLSTDGTLAAVRADMEALHRQTIVVPVLAVLSILLQ